MVADKSRLKDQRILAAAEEVFSHKGYTQTTLDEIIKIADTGKGTVYKYFNSKENLFYTLVYRKHVPFITEIKMKLAQTTVFEEKLSLLITDFISFFETNKIIWQVLLFEVTGGSRGWQLMRDSQGGYKPLVRWGREPSPEEIRIVEKYMDVLYEELDIVIDVLKYGVTHRILKPISLKNSYEEFAGHLFGGIAMTVFHGTSQKVDKEHFVRGMVDRFMNGHKLQ